MGVTEVGKELRVLRIIRGISRAKDMAEALGVTPQYLHAIERGAKRVPRDFMRRVLDAYDLSEEEEARMHRAIVRSTHAVAMDNTPPRVRELVVAIVARAHTLDDACLWQLEQLVKED